MVQDQEGTPNQLSQGDYIRISREMAESEAVQPYFPLAFAKSPEQPLEFDFDLFLLDKLKLPRPILQPSEGEQVFASREELIDRCKAELDALLRDRTRYRPRPREKADHLAKKPIRLLKRTLFMSEGRPLIRSGVESFDANLACVREDR